MAPTVPFKQLSQRHPDHDAEQWQLQRALATGGRALLGNRKLLSKVLPCAMNEPEDRYQRRLARAFYASPAGSILEAISAGLFADPLRATATGGAADEAAFYDAVQVDCSRPGGARQSLNEALREVVTDALVCGGVGWALVDFPMLPAGYEPPATLAHEEALGLRRAFVLPIRPEAVIDWETDDTGALSLAVVMGESARRTSLDKGRDDVTVSFNVMNARSWQRWEFRYDRQTRPSGPLPNDPCVLVASGNHGFGQVPLLRLELDRGLRAMDKLYSLAMAHADVTNACRISAARAMWQIPVSYQAGDDGAELPPEVAQDRYASRPKGPDDMLSMRDKDRLDFVGPDAAPINAGFRVADDIAQAMYAVMHSMALNADPRSAAALSRSGESKAQDRLAQSIVLRALGQIVREFAARVLELMRDGRGDADVRFTLKGLENFDATSVPELLAEATQVALLEIPSAAFQAAYKAKVAKNALGEDATPELMAQIKAELERGEATDHGDPHAEAGARAGAAAAIAAVVAGEPEQPPPTTTPTMKPHELSAADRRKARREARVNGA